MMAQEPTEPESSEVVEDAPPAPLLTLRDGLPGIVTDTLMNDAGARRRVADATLRLAESL